MARPPCQSIFIVVVAQALLLVVVAVWSTDAAESLSSSPLACNCSMRTNWEAGTSSISGPQSASSVDVCCSLCSAENRCAAWTFSSATHECWLKDNDNDGHQEKDRVSGSCRTPAPAPTPAPPPAPSTVVIAVTLDNAAMPVAQLSDRFVSYTLDWWYVVFASSGRGLLLQRTWLVLSHEQRQDTVLTDSMAKVLLRMCMLAVAAVRNVVSSHRSSLAVQCSSFIPVRGFVFRLSPGALAQVAKRGLVARRFRATRQCVGSGFYLAQVSNADGGARTCGAADRWVSRQGSGV